MSPEMAAGRALTDTETLIDLLAGEAEVGERIAVRVQRPHGIPGGGAQRQPEAAVDRLDGLEAPPAGRSRCM